MDTKNLKIAGLLSLSVLPIAASTASSAYAYGYNSDEPILNNCSDAVIQGNLSRLNALNIVKVDGLAPLNCYGYCVSQHDSDKLKADKCEKAEALAKAVTLLTPLAVKPKP